MPSTIQAIYILIVLLPGFFIVATVELLTGTREKVPLRLTVRALALSFVVYVVYSIFVESGFLPGLQIAVKSGTSGESQLMFPTVDIWGITALSGISLFVSVALSLAINKDWMRILRKNGTITRIGADEFLITGEIEWIQLHKKK